MTSLVELPLPRDQSPASLLAWSRTATDYMRRSRVAITREISVGVEEGLAPVQISIGQITEDVDEFRDDRTIALAAANAFAGQVQAAITAANGHAQSVYDDYQEAAAALQAATAQWYLTQAANMIEQYTRIEEDLVLSGRIDTVQASLATTNAAVTTEITARVNGDTALASQITTVQSQANGNTAAVQQLTASVNGISARWGVAISQNGHVTGLVQLDGGATGTNFTVVANRFIISHPSASGTLMTPFVVGLVGGISTIGIDGTVVVDGSIITRHILAGAITTDRIAAGAITTDRLAAGAVTAGTIAARSITADRIAANVLTATELAARTITADRIAVGAITSTEIAARSINADRIVAGSITGAEIAARTISADRIAVGAITANELAAGSITADRMNVSSLSSITANLGEITAAYMRSAQQRPNGQPLMEINLNNPRFVMRTP